MTSFVTVRMANSRLPHAPSGFVGCPGARFLGLRGHVVVDCFVAEFRGNGPGAAGG